MIVQHDDNRFTMLKVYTDGRRIVAECGLTFTQCRDSKLFPLGPQSDKQGNFIYTPVLSECVQS